MDPRTSLLLFALLRSAIGETTLTEEERRLYAPEQLREMLKVTAKHDVVHLLVMGLKKNGLLSAQDDAEKFIFKAVYRFERLQYEYTTLCEALEKAKIPFLPLKGAVLRAYYPEAWMRTSCDIDILVHREHLEHAISYLQKHYKYVEKERATHDVSLFSPMGIHVELHFDLVEEGRANNAIEVLRTVWDNVNLCENSEYRYEMTDAFFYFYHIAHMAKHFENGGCGIRPFIDLWLLQKNAGEKTQEREELLKKGDLLRFAKSAQSLSKLWFSQGAPDETLLQMQSFVLRGGSFGTTDNRVAAQQKDNGRMGYLMSRVFVPYERLVRYYPVLKKHRWLMPVMQVRRWCMLLRPDVAKRTKHEINANRRLSRETVFETQNLMKHIGL